MPAIHLTKRTIDALPTPEDGQAFYRDRELNGFGLRVGARTKTFFVEAQVRRRTIRVSIGRYPLMTPEQARRQALQRLSEMSRGQDPRAEEKKSRALSLDAAFAAFFETKTQLSPRTIENY